MVPGPWVLMDKIPPIMDQKRIFSKDLSDGQGCIFCSKKTKNKENMAGKRRTKVESDKGMKEGIGLYNK